MYDDFTIISKIKAGNVKEFERLFRANYSSLCLYSASIVGQVEVAEEIVQELFYVIWKNREKIEIVKSLKGYLFSSVRNRSIQYLNHCAVHNRYKKEAGLQINEDINNPFEELAAKDLESVINRAFLKMPFRQLKIFKLHRFEGKKYYEIAEELLVSVKTVEAEMSKALKVLRNEINQINS